ncbi:hypothetical protein BDV98DRAFT_607027 [Pterulicium gracile]|uniref:Uncharacterized protein n=1 Tax=Pterulicium gracile TaxID=1884261 RepID=A0A5C3QAY6_9AGAR|nr:hypothetical protein BDV98DRAFT_607027 [Pterula gracilis]
MAVVRGCATGQNFSDDFFSWPRQVANESVETPRAQQSRDCIVAAGMASTNITQVLPTEITEHILQVHSEQQLANPPPPPPVHKGKEDYCSIEMLGKQYTFTPTHIDQSDAEFTLVFFVDEGNNITTPPDSSFGAGNFVDTDLKVVVKPARGTKDDDAAGSVPPDTASHVQTHGGVLPTDQAETLPTVTPGPTTSENATPVNAPIITSTVPEDAPFEPRDLLSMSVINIASDATASVDEIIRAFMVGQAKAEAAMANSSATRGESD